MLRRPAPKILEHVHTGYHFAEDDALVVGDGVSVDGRGGSDENHGRGSFDLVPIPRNNF